jgi:hypothetical protein
VPQAPPVVNRLGHELTEATFQPDPNARQQINFGIYVFDEEERPAAAGGS